MGFIDRILGIGPNHVRQSETRRVIPPSTTAQTADERALERYRYMLRTAPPETLEQAHAEAFAHLMPNERRRILLELANHAPPSERAFARAVSPDDPQAMGRLATRTEMRRPGFMERTLGGFYGPGGSLFGSFAMGFLGSMVAHSFFSSLAAIANEPLVSHDHGTARSEGDDTDIGDSANDDIGGDFDGGDFGGGDFEM